MLKQFFSLLKRYILPYRKYLTWALILNFLSQWLNVFSFMAIVPILNILFKIDTKSYEYIPMDIHNLDKDVLINNAYYFVSNFVATNGAFYTLAMMGGILIFMTMLKLPVILLLRLSWYLCVQVLSGISVFRFIIKC